LRNRTFLLAAFICALIPEARASCIQSEPNRVATVTVTSCSTVGELAKARLGNVDLPWVVSHVNNVVKSNPGVVVAGRVTRKIHVEQYSDHEFRFVDIVPSDESAVWFVRGETLSCGAFKAHSVVELYATEKCCDIFPPMDVACLLELSQATPVGDHLRKFLEAALR
jgi:hypothetical protein